MKSIETSMKKIAANNRRRYHFKGYSVRHIVFYPVMVIAWCYYEWREKIQKKISSFYQWDENRANKIITWAIVHWANLKDDIVYYDCPRYGIYWNDKYHSRLFDRGFCLKFNDQLTEYLMNEYQLEGYEKEVDCYDGTVYFRFEEKA